MLGGRETVTVADYKALRYTMRCINESMRLYPHPPVLLRRANIPDQLPGENLPTLPAVQVRSSVLCNRDRSPHGHTGGSTIERLATPEPPATPLPIGPRVARDNPVRSVQTACAACSWVRAPCQGLNRPRQTLGQPCRRLQRAREAGHHDQRVQHPPLARGVGRPGRIRAGALWPSGRTGADRAEHGLPLHPLLWRPQVRQVAGHCQYVHTCWRIHLLSLRMLR